MATQSQLELQAAVRINALENVDLHRDIQNWEKQMKTNEKRNKAVDNVNHFFLNVYKFIRFYNLYL